MTLTEILVGIAGDGLNPSLRPLLERPLDAESWQAFVTKLDQLMLSTFALAACEQGTLAVTEPQLEDLRLRSEQATERCERAASSLEEVVTTLDRHGLDACVLHGAATSALDYPATHLRLYESVHVLVDHTQHDQAVDVLRADGVFRHPNVHSRARRRRDVWHRTKSGVEVGLYRAVTPGRFGGAIESKDLLANRVWFTPRTDPGGTALSALGTEERMIAACIHARFDRSISNLLVQRDVVQLVLRDDLSMRRVEELRAEWRVEAILADAVRRAWDTFSVPDVVPISAWSGFYQPYRRDQRKLEAHPLPATHRREANIDSSVADAAPQRLEP